MKTAPSALSLQHHSAQKSRVLLSVSVEPMRTPKRLKIAETRSRLIAVDWESLGYNITRCHTFNVTICYHYMTANNRSKADCLDMDPKGKTVFMSYIHVKMKKEDVVVDMSLSVAVNSVIYLKNVSKMTTVFAKKKKELFDCAVFCSSTPHSGESAAVH